VHRGSPGSHFIFLCQLLESLWSSATVAMRRTCRHRVQTVNVCCTWPPDGSPLGALGLECGDNEATAPIGDFGSTRGEVRSAVGARFTLWVGEAAEGDVVNERPVVFSSSGDAPSWGDWGAAEKVWNIGARQNRQLKWSCTASRFEWCRFDAFEALHQKCLGQAYIQAGAFLEEGWKRRITALKRER
jgi:hypothetical protein